MTKRRAFILLDIFLLVVIIVVAVGFTLHQLNKPSTGNITQGAPIAQTTFSVDLTPKPIPGRVASYSVPKGMTAQPQQLLTGSQVQSASFGARDVESWVLTTEILKTNGQLTSDSSYTLRKNNPAQYTQSTTVINGQTFTVMTDTTASGFSKVAFFTHEDFVAEVSLIGDDSSGSEPLVTTFNMVLSSWKWEL